VFPQPHVLLPVGQEVCDPPAGGVGHVQLGELVPAVSRSHLSATEVLICVLIQI